MTLEDEALREGLEVQSADREPLGHIGELGPLAFKVAAPMELDYWLHLSLLGSIENDVATLRVTWDRLPAYRGETEEEAAALEYLP